METVRLQKFLADCSVASRRKSEELIAQGAVKVNGKTAQIGDKISPRHDIVTVRGKRVSVSAQPMYIMLHKPRGFITTMSDEQGRKCVAELVADAGCRLYPVGRLDRESEGLLLMTNDGEFSNAMMHPSRHVPKVYRVTIRPNILDEHIAALSEGIEIEGRMTAPAQVRLVTRETERAVIEITLREGRNRQIRKMCEALGLDVARLKRVAVGSLKLGTLPCGKWRELTAEETEKLKKAAGLQ